MRNILIPAIFCLLFSASASAGTITAIANGNWISASTWDADRAPQDNDVVVIPATKVVSFNGAPYPKNTPTTRPTLAIKIYGTLDFSTAGNDKLYLDLGSTIEIFTNGKIQTTNSSTEIIAIYTGSTDNTVWTGSPSALNGPASATATTSGFANGILPVNFESFTIKKDNKGFATLSWITNAEMNASHFEIEKSLAGSVNWQLAGNVYASGNSVAYHQYSFAVALEAGENRFRLKEIDNDGKLTYSNVVSIKYNGSNTVNVIYDQRTHQILLDDSNKDQLKIHIFDVSGHVIYSGAASAPVTFKPASAGVYFVNILNRDLRVSKKIMVY